MRTLYYSPGACSLGSLVALIWKAEPFELCRVPRELRRTPVYLAINPLGVVPALKIDDRTLIESSAILLHLAKDADNEPLSLPGPQTSQWDAVQQWLSYLGSGFHAAFFPYFGPQKFIAQSELHDEVRKAALVRIGAELQYTNRELEGKRFLLGARRSILDPYFYAMSRWANKHFDLEKDFPNVARHQRQELEDEAVQIGQAIERGEPAPQSPAGLRRHFELSSDSP